MATFNILGFNQKMLLEIQKKKQINLNGNDLIVLRNMVDMIEGDRLVKKTIKYKRYTWIKYSLLVENLLIVSDKEDTFKKIVTKLIKCGLLERVVLKSIGNGAYTYFRKTAVLESILYVPGKQDNLKKKSVIKNKSTECFKDMIKDDIQSIEERLINETGASKERVIAAMEYAETRNANNLFLYAKSIIKNNWDNMSAEILNINYKKNKLNGFNNFTPRNYNYKSLEEALLYGIHDDAGEFLRKITLT